MSAARDREGVEAMLAEAEARFVTHVRRYEFEQAYRAGGEIQALKAVLKLIERS